MDKMKKMKLRQILILIVGLLLCVLWVDVITPRWGDAGRTGFLINYKIVVVWVVGWIVILTFTVLEMINRKKK